MTLITGHEDSENEMWSEYLKIVDEYDKRLTDRWKEDTKGVLVFVSSHARVPVCITMTIRETGLFSTTVASFIIASYPQLSPDTGSQTVFLLQQLSQQFAGFTNGTQVQPEPLPSSPPSASVVCVNILWLLSFLFSTTSALFATMMQQWGRRYLALPQSQSIPSDRARVRSFLFLGIEKYSMDLAVEIAPTLLHLSVFLFYIGLVIFFFTIHKTAAIAILISVGLFGLVYFTTTILPCIDHSCPYSTPMSRPWQFLWHASLSFVGGCLSFLLKLFYCCCAPYNSGDATPFTQRTFTHWLDTIEEFAKKHGRRLRDGFQETVVKYAGGPGAPENTDVEALTWSFRLLALSEKSEIQKFIASIPGERVVQLFKQGNPFDHKQITFRDHLSTLLRTSYAPDTAGLTKEMRKDRLLVCLNSIRHIAKDSSLSPSSPSFSPDLLDDMRLNFANMALMRPLWADSDPVVRVTARSICALLARQLLRKSYLEASELSWLEDVMGRPSSMIYNARNNLATVDNMNVDSFVNGVLSHQTEDLPAQATIFEETLKDIMNRNSQTSLHADTFEEWISSLIQRMEQEEGHQDRDNVADKIRRMLQKSPASDT